ncbi:DNA topoisomerase IB [Lysobacter koreensis]|uniref:DNA topoisomerase n=1 Tax=Lysobacter koreensis TaxID=266122 RepID=A0ABW2YN31_9GAMM
MPRTPANAITANNHDNAQAATDSGLRYVSDLEPGLRRRRAGKGFRYLDAGGRAVRNQDTLDRIRALAIPPAYTDVWICARADGHLQATGRDARGRKQYRYHAHWQRVRGDGKFARVVAFGEALPRLRRRLRADLALAGFPRDKVLAMVVALLAETLVRVGNDAYARSNKSYGLTTLRNRHVAFVQDGRARFRFRGKGGLEHDVVLDDRRLTGLIRRCQQLPGQALFQYRDDDGAVQPVDSGEVNDYLRAAMGEAFTAKDFRTWGGTLTAFQQFAATPLPGDAANPPSETALAAAQNEVVKRVAHELGNTPAVCRKAYIDPRVFAGWRDGSLQRAAAAAGSDGARGARQWEQATLKFLKRAQRQAGRSRKP